MTKREIPLFWKIVFWLGIFWLTSFVAAKLVYVFLGQKSRTPGAFDYFLIFYYYRDNAEIVHKAMVAGYLTFGGVAALYVTLILVSRINDSKQKLHGESQFATKREAKEIGLFDEDARSIILGEIDGRLVRAGDVTPLILVAPTRSGKGVSQIIPNLLAWPDSVVAYDPKIELYQSVSAYRKSRGQKVFLFAPGMPFSHRWNPFDMWTKYDPQLIDYVMLVANILCPTPQETKEAMWTQEARKLFLGVALVMYDCDDYVSIPTIAQWIDQHPVMAADDEGTYPPHSFHYFLETKKDTMSQVAYDNLLNFAENAANTRSGIRTQLTSSLSVFQSPSVAYAFSGSDFDLRTLRKVKQSIFVGSSKRTLVAARDALSLFFQMMVTLMTEELPQANEPYHVLALFDEFSGLGRMEVISRAISDVAGYNLRIFLVIQNLAQLSNPKLYGKDGLNEIMGNMRHQTYYRPSTLEDAKRLSEILGDNTVKATSESRPTFFGAGGFSENTSDQKRALMLPQEILKLANDKALVSVPGHSPVLCNKIIYYKDRRFAGRYFDVRNPKATPALSPPDVPMVEHFRTKLGNITSYHYWFNQHATADAVEAWGAAPALPSGPPIAPVPTPVMIPPLAKIPLPPAIKIKVEQDEPELETFDDNDYQDNPLADDLTVIEESELDTAEMDSAYTQTEPDDSAIPGLTEEDKKAYINTFLQEYVSDADPTSDLLKNAIRQSKIAELRTTPLLSRKAGTDDSGGVNFYSQSLNPLSFDNLTETRTVPE